MTLDKLEVGKDAVIESVGRKRRTAQALSGHGADTGYGSDNDEKSTDG